MLVAELEQLDQAVDQMEGFQNKVTGSLEDVEQIMAALRASWHGPASDAQAQAQQQWKAGAEQMTAALGALKKVLEAAHKNYADAISKNGQMWGAT